MSQQPPLRIGLVGSGFIANFHLTALEGVRDCQVTRVYSPTPAHREAAARRANERGHWTLHRGRDAGVHGACRRR